MERSLEGKVAVVTGSGRGIGLGIAKKLAEKGAAIVISDINEENAKHGVEKIFFDVYNNSDLLYQMNYKKAILSPIFPIKYYRQNRDVRSPGLSDTDNAP